MSLQITYYAPNSTMGDISEVESIQFRVWAEGQLSAEYHDAEIEVSDQESASQCYISGAECFEQEDEIKEFVSRLWERCNWDF